jgi:hypothetical protein
MFKSAWEHGITILPILTRSNIEGTRFLTSADAGYSNWNFWVIAAVERYGYNGTFWNGKINPRPVTTWEVWNEPNLPKNNPQRTQAQCEAHANWTTFFEKPSEKKGYLGCTQPDLYGSFLSYTAASIQAASQKMAAVNTGVLFGGLAFPYGQSAGSFLSQAYAVSGVPSSFGGLSIHPYGFDFAHPAGSKTITEFQSEVNGIRSTLNGLSGGASKSLWITELGWPLNSFGDTKFPAVKDEAEQARLLNESINWIKGVAGEKLIETLVWYNIRDAGWASWEFSCGLRDQWGNYRQQWRAFQEQTGAAPWPGPTTTTVAASEIQEHQAALNGVVNPGGYSSSYHFEYGTTTEYGRAVPIPDASAGAGTTAIGVSMTASNLLPSTTYHYRLVASSAGGTNYGADSTFKTTGARYMRGLSNGSGFPSWKTMLTMGVGPTATGDFNGDGKADVIAVEWDGGISYRYRVGFGNGTKITSWSTVLSGMSMPENLDVADFNGDGKADIVSVEAEGGGKYRYMVGLSTGTGISSWSKVLGGMSPQTRMSVGDFNADGKADIVGVEAEGGGKYRYMVGLSTGTGISSWSPVLSGMSPPARMSVGDFNADGKADIVGVEEESAGKYRYQVGFSNGTGISSWSKVLSGMSYPEAMDVTDFNADGKADIVATEIEPGGSFRYKVGFSNGTTVSSWETALAWMANPGRTNVGDFNGDGRADIVSVEPDGAGKYRYQVGFSGASAEISNWSTVLTGMSLPTFMAVGDFNKDGKADIVSVEPDGAGKYRYMLGLSNGAGISSWSSILSGMSLPTRMELGDVNADGKADIVGVEEESAGKYRYMFGLSNGTGISSWGSVLTGMSYPHKMSVGDFNGDGKADIVSVEEESAGKYRYMRGLSNGTGISSWASALTGMSVSHFLDIGDVNKDGKADIVSVEAEGGGRYRYMLGLSNGTGISSWSTALSNMSGPYFLDTGDVDGDGKADIVSLEQG